jgi:ribosomal protein S18 acetylase RimI-like enzyme
MNRAQAHAIDSGAARIDLETETNNVNAQQLYETLGYVRETEFYKYSLSL